MSFYDTGLPVPSNDPRDLDDNAKHIDELVNSTFPTFTDRLGTTRRTLAGIEADAEAATLRGDLAADDGAELVGLRSPLPEALAETVASWIFRFLPDLETFGGKGDYTTLNDVALDKLLASGAKGMRLNQGIYRFSDTVNFPTGFTIMGVGSPTLGHGTFDDKQWLRTGYKDQMPGSSLILSGAPSTSYPCPQRVGEFATLSPCVRIYKGGEGSVGTHWSGFAIIQDMECRVPDGSRFTLPAEDNHAAGYNTGLMIDDVAQLKRTDVVIFGYFSSLGTAISSVSGNDDPDYNQMIGGSTMGRYGLGLLGSNNGPASHGLSGTHSFGHAMYSLDHHSRGEMTLPELTAYYADADTWSCLYIDGDVDASSAEINGHEFHAPSIRSNANHAIRHDHVSDLKFFGGVYEFRPYGIPNSDVPSFLATANAKRGIEYNGLRNNFLESIFNPNYSDIITCKLIVSGDPLNGRLGVFGRDPSGGYSGAMLGSDGNIGDAAIQLTKDANDGSSGWRMLIDVSAVGTPLQWKLDGVQALALTGTGALNLGAPVGSDATVLLTSNGGSNIWAIRPQVSSAGQLQFRFGGSGSPVLLQLLTTGTLTPGSTGTQDVGSTTFHFRDTYSNRYFIGTGTIQQISGSGTPEGVVTAPVGSTFQRSDGGAVTTLYVKETGTGNTGWVAK